MNTVKDICELIPYDSFCVLDNEVQWLYDTACTMQSIVEIGSFRGRSTAALCLGCPGTVLAVDPFIYDGTYDTFIKNMSTFNNCNPHVMTSQVASKIVADLSVDMVFIDAEHDYESVKQDIGLWTPKAKKLICGHDYIDVQPGVMRAVDEAFGSRVKRFAHCIWMVEI